ncbi:FAD binding domain-containing protein [Ensifer sp.]|jgi:CO/xanthine dehydrogenase FAD-binding subunit|uniref:FAD binding domain-containing protein n=1 Tax=Ensifer sp. TaxID=1872086 RepID=UPI002E126855|nr:FAD binding domain-containing protein [Ensifer sp.]
MDINTITSVRRPRTRGELWPFQDGDAWLGGGTWLFSEPQPKLGRLIDLSKLDWPSLTVSDQGLSIAATCRVATLDAFEPPPAWPAARLIGSCCRAFLASFKIWNMATVGGNLCMSLPAGPMISLTAALDGICTVWSADGSERTVPVVDFVKGPLDNALRPGEILRRIDLPWEALTRRTAFRRASLTPLGRSGVLLIGSLAASGAFALTVTASTRRPVQLAFKGCPTAADLSQRLETSIPDAFYYDDLHGRPDWRRHMTQLFAEEIRQELGGRP